MDTGVLTVGWTTAHFLPGWSCLNWTTVMVKTHFSLLPASSAAWWGWGVGVGWVVQSVNWLLGLLVGYLVDPPVVVDHLVSRLVGFSVSWPVN